MKPEELLRILSVAEKLKCNTRHSYTSSGRHESVAEHSWRITLMAMLLEEEFPDADMNKVIRMCLIHDLGEAFTGDIPAFNKTDSDASKEENILDDWVDGFSEPTRSKWLSLLKEMNALETIEAKIYKSLDKIEAIIQHDEADLSTWIPLEYDLQFSYGQENMEFSPYMKEFRRVVDARTRRKIEEGKKSPETTPDSV